MGSPGSIELIARPHSPTTYADAHETSTFGRLFEDQHCEKHWKRKKYLLARCLSKLVKN